jgi:glycosyltransferase involved in cell wall biosynthesis
MIEVLEKSKFYKNFTLIKHKENKGAAAARNTGIKAANSENIMLFDADDFVVTNFYKIIETYIDVADIAHFNINLIYSDNKITQRN